MFGQWQDIIDTFSEWRDHECKHTDTVIQIQTEESLFDHVRKVSVCCCDDPHIDRNRRAASELSDFLFLQNTKELRLQNDRHFANFVEKYGSVLRKFK